MPTMTKFTAAPNGVAAAALVHLESGDVNVFVHAIRIEAPVRNQQSQIHAVVQHVMKEVKGVDPSAQFLSTTKMLTNRFTVFLKVCKSVHAAELRLSKLCKT